MKKGLILGLTAMMVLSMAACGDDTAASADGNTTQATEAVAGTDTGIDAAAAAANVALKDLDVDTYVVLGDYKNLNVEAPEPSKEEIDYYTDYYFQMLVDAEDGITDRAVKNGDMINLDYSGRKVDEEEPFEGGTAQDQFLGIGSGTFIPGFEEQLVGVMPGETVDLPMTFPKEYHSADLAGQPVIFTCTVNYILPEMSDELVQGFMLDGVNTVDDFREYIRSMLKGYAMQDSEGFVMDALLEQTTFSEFPEAMITERKESIRKSLEASAQSYEMTAEDLVSAYYGQDLETFLQEQATEMLKLYMACQAIANRENLNVTDEELEENLSVYASYVGFEDVETFLKEYNGGATREDYREQIMYSNVMDFLASNNQ